MAAYLEKNIDGDDRLLITGLRTVNLETALVTYLDATATVEATVVDRDTQVAVSGETWPVALTYIVASAGDFHGPLRDTLEVLPHQILDVQVVIDAGVDQKRTLVLRGIAVIDRG
jgi:hypothetical protein